MMNRYIIFIIGIFFTKFLSAQNQSNFQSDNNCGITRHNLSIGEEVPRIFIPKIVRNSFSSGYLQDFKENLVILDFWSVGCSSCIEKLPRLDSLQKVFQNRIKILPVTFDHKESVEVFFAKNKYGKGTNLPTVIEDRNLSEWFKHYAISHMVWIMNDTIVAITGPEYVTKSNIDLILKGDSPNWPVKNDGIVIDPSKPFILKNKSTKILSYSTVSGFNEGNLNGLDKIGTIIDSVRDVTRTYIFNLDIIACYKYILWKLNKNVENISLDVKDRSRYIYSSTNGTKAEWNSKNAICYEAEYPGININKDQEYLLIKGDLDRLLNLETKIEKKLTKCLVLKTTNSDKLIKGEAGKFQIYNETNVLKFRSSPLSVVLSHLNYDRENLVEINESNYPGLVDMDIDLTPKMDIVKINRQLQKYGLILQLEDRLLETFCIKELSK